MWNEDKNIGTNKLAKKSYKIKAQNIQDCNHLNVFG
jgi:hypothetical protein